MKWLCVAVLVMLVSVSPVAAAPDCPPTPTPPVTAVTLADADANGSWYVWIGVSGLMVAVWGGVAWSLGFENGHDKGWHDGYAARRELFR
ncbi:MAG: hypothetical protein WC455_25515 [Dehalococcoidia bacterium]|jgi:hypothetical protein